jgi:glycosyltransferase involved in cell wall biosynthesis
LDQQNLHQDRAIREEIAEYCKALGARDSRIRYQLRPKNLGPSENHKWVFENARGDYVILIGDDDHLLVNAIEALVSAVVPDVSVVFDRGHMIDRKVCGFHASSLLLIPMRRSSGAGRSRNSKSHRDCWSMQSFGHGGKRCELKAR